MAIMDDKRACPLCTAAVGAAVITTGGGDYRHCAACDLVFLEPGQRPSSAVELAHYRTHDNRVDDPAYRRFLGQLAEPLMRRLAPGAAGLDVGAGPGPALAAMLAERGFPTAVYDPFFAPDRSALDRRYDFIACTEVVEHLHTPAREFALFDRLLNPGGWLGLMTELRPPLSGFLQWYYHRDPTHVSFYSVATMRWIARRFGWRLDECGPRVVLLQKPGAGPLQPA